MDGRFSTPHHQVCIACITFFPHNMHQSVSLAKGKKIGYMATINPSVPVLSQSFIARHRQWKSGQITHMAFVFSMHDRSTIRSILFEALMRIYRDSMIESTKTGFYIYSYIIYPCTYFKYINYVRDLSWQSSQSSYLILFLIWWSIYSYMNDNNNNSSSRSHANNLFSDIPKHFCIECAHAFFSLYLSLAPSKSKSIIRRQS